MTTNTQKLLSLCAILLAVLFPIYWFTALGGAIQNAEVALRQDLTSLDGWDFLLLVIGVLEIVVYLGLRQFFLNQINGGLPATLLLVLAALVAVFHSSLLIDLTAGLNLIVLSASFINSIAIASVVILALHAVVLLALSITLLTRFSDLSPLLKAFTCVALIAAVCQISVFFALLNLILFPILMLITAIHFYSGDTTVEVV